MNVPAGTKTCTIPSAWETRVSQGAGGLAVAVLVGIGMDGMVAVCVDEAGSALVVGDGEAMSPVLLAGRRLQAASMNIKSKAAAYAFFFTETPPVLGYEA